MAIMPMPPEDEQPQNPIGCTKDRDVGQPRAAYFGGRWSIKSPKVIVVTTSSAAEPTTIADPGEGEVRARSNQAHLPVGCDGPPPQPEIMCVAPSDVLAQIRTVRVRADSLVITAPKEHRMPARECFCHDLHSYRSTIVGANARARPEVPSRA
jgi:hypothetical protein